LADDVIIGLGALAIGGFMYLDRRRFATVAATRTWFWQGKQVDVDDYAFCFGAAGWAMIIAGVVMLIWRPFA
jgi:hypothetical protein